MADVFASSSSDFVASEMDALGKVANSAYALVSTRDLNGALAMVAAAGARNELEAALAANAAAAHQQALHLLSLIQNVDGAPYAAAAYGTTAAKLMKAYAYQLLVLDRLRRTADQRIVVEHLHLEPGAKAVFNQVGKVEGRGHANGEGQEHAAVEGRADQLAEVGCPLRGEDKGRKALPEPGRAREEEVPHARRCAR